MITNIGNGDERTKTIESKRDKGDRYILIRNILNIIFMLGALTGMAIYFKMDHQIGTIVILSSMLFKIVECVFRFIK